MAKIPLNSSADSKTAKTPSKIDITGTNGASDIKPEFQSGPQIVVGSLSSGSASAGVSGPKRGTIPAASPSGGARVQRVYDEMLRDPTVKLATDVVIAMLKRIPWTVEGEDQVACDYLEKQIEPFRESIIRSAFRGFLRDGWRAFEIAFGTDGMLQTIAGIKPLRARLTEPLAYVDTGDFAGVESRSATNVPGREEVVIIDEDHVILVNFDDDGFGDLGEPLLRCVMGPHLKWEACDVGAQRYDKKVAGGFLFIKYPVGRTPYAPRGGVETDNAEIMIDLANSFESAGFAGAPVRVDPDTGVAEDASAWSVEHIAAGGGLQSNFIAREKYLDALKLRAFGIPERSTTEGTFGTKAEAEAHADIGVIINVDRLSRIIDNVNTGLEAYNKANWGRRDYCRIVLGKLDPADRELFASIFTALMSDPVFGERIAGQVDVNLLLEKLNVPTIQLGETVDLLGQSNVIGLLDSSMPGGGIIPAPGQSAPNNTIPMSSGNKTSSADSIVLK